LSRSSLSQWPLLDASPILTETASIIAALRALRRPARGHASQQPRRPLIQHP
jgi:hypothetical protein